MRRLASRLISGVDNFLARHCVPQADHPKVITLCGHSVLGSRADLAREVMHPQQRLLLSELRAVLEYLLAVGFRFVRPDDLGGGLATDGRYAMLTFDDGYYNNVTALDLLQELAIPAVFFVVPWNIEQGESYWWDAIYRQGRRRGRSLAEIEAFIHEVKLTPPAQIPTRLAAGGISPTDLRPVSDLDRPLRRDELIALARHSCAVIGNHTHDHEILTTCDPLRRRHTLVEAQTYLKGTCGSVPTAIAYPNGSYTQAVVVAARDAGLHWGFTLDPHWDAVPTRNSDCLQLGRFLIWGEVDPILQCNRARLRISATAVMSRMRRVVARTREGRDAA